MRVPREFWEDLEEGDRLTVLYSEHNPDINMLYLPGSYAVVPLTYAAVSMREDSKVNR